MENSYSPYSNFPVGAALITEEGEIFTGTNIENVSFGLSICAERVAIFKAISSGKRNFKAIVIYNSQEKLITPCGACRQVLLEFAPDCEIINANDQEWKLYNLQELLPEAFITIEY